MSGARIRAICASGKEVTDVSNPDEWRPLLGQGVNLLWVDIEGSEGVRDLLEAHFGFHPLAIDDALHQTHVPRIDDWHDYLFVVASWLQMDPASCEVAAAEIDMFVGENYIVTVHDRSCTPLDEVWKACSARPASALKGPDHVLYLLLDNIIDGYFRTMDDLDSLIDKAEDSVFDTPGSDTLQQFFSLKRSLLDVRRVLAPTREVLNKLSRDEFLQIDSEDRIYFRDLFDHLVRLVDINESLRDVVGGGMEAYLSVISNRLNEVMKTLTVVTVLFMPLSFITGLFGMNFFGGTLELPMPALKWPLFAASMALMVIVPALMAVWLKRRGWM